MRLLLDTHSLLWFALTDPQISSTATSLIMDPANEKLVSPASYWEIAIKISVNLYSRSVVRIMHVPFQVMAAFASAI